jgi:hypothetical protein
MDNRVLGLIVNDEQPGSPFVEGLGLVDLVDRWHLDKDSSEHL